MLISIIIIITEHTSVPGNEKNRNLQIQTNKILLTFFYNRQMWWSLQANYSPSGALRMTLPTSTTAAMASAAVL
jgi:hypothetical protein